MSTSNQRKKISITGLKMRIALPELKEAELLQHEWFVEYKNTDTRNAIAQGLELVDHGGDSIFYNGTGIPGFKVTFNQVLFLVASRPDGVYKFTVYHRALGTKNWAQWKENTKTAREVITKYMTKKLLKKASGSE